uniref:Uncharacterized protein n=1 Tax=Panagrolaimus superbus TaxID=310955 RepID=A0A914Y0Y2_9BILA
MNDEEASSYLVSLHKVLKTRDFIKHDHLHRTRVFENMLPEDPKNGCYMYDAIIGYSYAHPPVLAELKRITYDLVDTVCF